MAYSVEHKGKGFFMVLTGLVTINDLDEANGIILGSEKFDSHTFQIINLLQADFSTIAKTKIEAKQTGAIDWAASKTRSHVKVAIVGTDTAAVRFSEEYIATSQMLGTNWTFNIFSDMDSANDWVGI